MLLTTIIGRCGRRVWQTMRLLLLLRILFRAARAICRGWLRAGAGVGTGTFMASLVAARSRVRLGLWCRMSVCVCRRREATGLTMLVLLFGVIIF